MEGAESGPDQDSALDREGQGDPFTVEANRDSQSSKGECESAEEEPRKRYFALLLGGQQARDKEVRSGQGQDKQSERPAMLRPEHGVGCGQVIESIQGDQKTAKGIQGTGANGIENGQGRIND